MYIYELLDNKYSIQYNIIICILMINKRCNKNIIC